MLPVPRNNVPFTPSVFRRLTNLACDSGVHCCGNAVPTMNPMPMPTRKTTVVKKPNANVFPAYARKPWDIAYSSFHSFHAKTTKTDVKTYAQIIFCLFVGLPEN